MKPSTASCLKQLERRLSEATARLKAIVTEQQEVTERLRRERETIQRLQVQINELKEEEREPVVSEHALLRYFERILGFNLEEIGKKVLTPEIAQQVKVCGPGIYPVGDTHKVKVANGVVVTILT